MSRSCTHVGRNSAEHKCVVFCRVLKRKKYINDIRKTCKSEYGNRHFWCRGYYVDTVGKNAKKIQEYIANQLQDDLEYDQMTLKEYIDPFTGEPVKRNK